LPAVTADCIVFCWK